MSLSLTPLAKLPPPLDGYTLIERLGRGGFGEVWKAEAPGGLLKAIKFVFGDLDADDEEENRSARQEEKALKRVKNIRHPYVLSLERYDIIDGQLVIVMELADRNLWDRFRECHSLGMPGIPREELLRYMEEAAEALDLMNNHYSIQHLDVKPQNLFLVFNHVKVGDFGLAKVLEGVRGTITGGVTPVYAGPETFNGDVSRFTDQYSLAIVYQEMLTGKRPFNGSNTKQLVMQHLTGQPDLDALPQQDRTAIARGLAKEPEQRWPSCAELVRALRQSQFDSVKSAPRSAIVVAEAPLSAKSSVTTPQPTLPTIPARRATSQPHTLVVPAAAGVSTPMPALVTPRLVTPQAASSATPTRAQPRPVVHTARMSNLSLAALERSETGILMPALVVAVGGSGLLVLNQFRQAVAERFGTLDALKHVRFLYVDTDPAAAAATEPNQLLPLAANEVVVARLNRSGHYIQNEQLPPVEQWMPPGVLYRLPREARPADGVRAFGRLALVDHYRTIVQRIQEQLEAFVSDAALDAAATATGLGVRSNRARVIIAANLAGGTGGGMAIDLAYIIRRELRSIGYRTAHVSGMFLVPPLDAGKTPALANAYAALAELRTLQGGAAQYTGRFDIREQPIVETEAPFQRIALLQLGKTPNPKDQQRTAGLAARAMFLELFTPVGRCCDELRGEADRLKGGEAVVQPFGLYRLNWPRAAMLACATRQFTQRIIDRWSGRNDGRLRDAVNGWLDERWTNKRLTLEDVVDRFNEAVAQHLANPADTAFAAMLHPLRPQAAAGRLQPEAAAEAIQRVMQLVGKPEQEREDPGTLRGVLAKACKAFAKDVETTMFSWTGWMIEHPNYRLPGAEEAVTQMSERVARTLSALEGPHEKLSDEVSELYTRLLSLLGSLGNAGRGVIGPSRTTIGTELLAAAAQFARKRLMLLVLESTRELYRSTANVLPDCLREVHDLRRKLQDLRDLVEPTADAASSPGPGRMILPQGVTSLDQAADGFINMLPAEAIVEFDATIQTELTKKFNGVVGLTTKAAQRADFLRWIRRVAREFLDSRLEVADPAAILFRNKEPGDKLNRLLTRAFEHAAPDIVAVGGREQAEAPILACPASPDGDRLRDLMRELVPEARLVSANLTDDIVFFREYPLLPIAATPQMGEAAREAYLRQLDDQHPHARTDIPWNA